MQHLEVSGAVRHIYIYVIRRLKVNCHHQYNFETAYKFKMPEPSGTLCKVRHFQYKAHTNRSFSYLVRYTLIELFKNMSLY